NEALIAEFGEDLEEVPSAPSRSDSGGDAPDTIARLQAQNALLVKLFEEGVTPLVKKADEALKSVKSKSSALKMLKGALQVKDGELSAARDASRALETELSNMRGELQKQLDERTTLESENKRLSARLASAQ